MRISTYALLLLGLLPTVSQAQSPALTSTVPARNSYNGSLTGPLTLTFSRPVAAPGDIKVNSNQAWGRRAGTFSGVGTNQILFQPSTAFAPGERVSVTVPASVSQPAQVVEFRAAAGRGSATFEVPVTIGPPPNDQPSQVVAGDFDHDGDIDLLACGTSGGIICLNDGKGNFTAQPTVVQIPARLRSLHLADFNGDGHLDIVSSGRSDMSVLVFSGTGQGTFLRGVPVLLPSFNSETVTGDFNADGLLDIIVGEPLGSGTALHFLPGVSNGNMVSTRREFVSLAGRDLEAADMDEDGDLDLLLVTDAILGVYLNDGSGQFTLGKSLAVNSFSGSITTGDFNNDGHTDVVCSSYESANLSLVLGNGKGDLQPVQNVVALSRTWFVASGDMDGDADLDLLVTNDRGITQILLNNGRGQFSAASAILLGFEPFSMADAADLNGDGALDVFTGHSVSNGSMPHGIDIFFNKPAIVTRTATPTEKLNFAVYPNPAREQVVVQLPSASGPVTVELRDALGRLILCLPAQRPGSNGSLPISLAGVAPGLYLIHTQSATSHGSRWLEVQ